MFGQGKLRIGLQEQGLLTALAHAVRLQREGATNKGGGLAEQLEQAAQIVKQVYSECPSFDELVPALLNAPIKVDFHLMSRPCTDQVSLLIDWALLFMGIFHDSPNCL